MLEFKGRFSGIETLDNGNYKVSFETDTIIPKRDFPEKKMRITCKEWREKKSSAQNAFLWEYISQLASVLNTSKDDMYQLLLERYPIFSEIPPLVMRINDKDVSEILKILSETDSKDKYSAHWIYCGLHPKDKEVGIFKKILGVSQMDTKQIASFTDSVLEECRENDIKIMEMRY